MKIGTLEQRHEIRQLIEDIRQKGIFITEIAARLGVPYYTAKSWAQGKSTPRKEEIKQALTDLWAEVTE